MGVHEATGALITSCLKSSGQGGSEVLFGVSCYVKPRRSNEGDPERQDGGPLPGDSGGL